MSRDDKPPPPPVDISSLAERFAFEYRDCNPNGSYVIGALTQLLTDVARSEFERGRAAGSAKPDARPRASVTDLPYVCAAHRQDRDHGGGVVVGCACRPQPEDSTPMPSVDQNFGREPTLATRPDGQRNEEE